MTEEYPKINVNKTGFDVCYGNGSVVFTTYSWNTPSDETRREYCAIFVEKVSRKPTINYPPRLLTITIPGESPHKVICSYIQKEVEALKKQYPDWRINDREGILEQTASAQSQPSCKEPVFGGGG